MIKVQVDRSRAPCIAASMAHLAERGYYAGSTCHRHVREIFVLQCGDPTATGYGTPDYQFADEGLTADLVYHEGDVAMVNTGKPITNGGRFFFVYQPDCPLDGDYTT